MSGTNIRTENKNVDLIVDLATGVIEVSRPEVAPGCLTAWGEVSVTPRVSATDIRHTCIGKRVTSILSLSRMTGRLTIESFWYQEGGKNADDSWMGKYACTRAVRRF